MSGVQGKTPCGHGGENKRMRRVPERARGGQRAVPEGSRGRRGDRGQTDRARAPPAHPVDAPRIRGRRTGEETAHARARPAVRRRRVRSRTARSPSRVRRSARNRIERAHRRRCGRGAHRRERLVFAATGSHRFRSVGRGGIAGRRRHRCDDVPRVAARASRCVRGNAIVVAPRRRHRGATDTRPDCSRSSGRGCGARRPVSVPHPLPRATTRRRRPNRGRTVWPCSDGRARPRRRRRTACRSFPTHSGPRTTHAWPRGTAGFGAVRAPRRRTERRTRPFCAHGAPFRRIHR